MQDCVQIARLRHHLPPEALDYKESVRNATVLGDFDELKAAVSNLIDNAIKYSGHVYEWSWTSRTMAAANSRSV